MISIIVPVFNSAAHVERCLTSLACQTDGDIEVLVVDDASTDGSRDLVESFSAAHPDLRLSVVLHRQNEGLGVARRSGFAAASGEFIYFLDSDDELLPDAVAAMRRAIRSREAHDTVFVFDILIGSPQTGWARSPGGRDDLLVGPEQVVGALLRSRLSPFMWNKLYPRMSLHETHFSELRRGEDVPSIVEIAHAIPRVERVPLALHRYHQDPSSLSKGTAGLAAWADPVTGVSATIRESLTRHGTFEPLRGLFEDLWLPGIALNTVIVLARASESSREFRRTARPFVQAYTPAALLRTTRKGNRRAGFGLAMAKVAPGAFRRLAIGRTSTSKVVESVAA